MLGYLVIKRVWRGPFSFSLTWVFGLSWVAALPSLLDLSQGNPYAEHWSAFSAVYGYGCALFAVVDFIVYKWTKAKFAEVPLSGVKVSKEEALK